MVDIEGFITVAEAAKRMHRSQEQVRRNLRQGKLRGKRVGNQWFVAAHAVMNESLIRATEEGTRRDVPEDEDSKWLIPRWLLEEIDRSREELFKRNGTTFDIVAELREDRENGHTVG